MHASSSSRSSSATTTRTASFQAAPPRRAPESPRVALVFVFHPAASATTVNNSSTASFFKAHDQQAALRPFNGYGRDATTHSTGDVATRRLETWVGGRRRASIHSVPRSAITGSGSIASNLHQNHHLPSQSRADEPELSRRDPSFMRMRAETAGRHRDATRLSCQCV